MSLNTQNLLEISKELTTVRDYFRYAYSRFNEANLFYGHGTDNALDEARTLILTAVNLPPGSTNELFDAKLTMMERRYLCDLIFQRIQNRIPTAYLLKKAWFAGIEFYVDERVIIPRSPIAELILNGFSPWLQNEENYVVLDLCTGSGCIAVACALLIENCQVDGVDIDQNALAVAKININKYDLENNVELIQSDLFEKVEQKYHIIVSNPPYVSEQEYRSLPSEYQHEPMISLLAEESGIAIVKRILNQAVDYLLPGGLLIVEVGNAQDALIEAFPTAPFIWLDFEYGGDGVFLLTYEQLCDYQHLFRVN